MTDKRIRIVAPPVASSNIERDLRRLTEYLDSLGHEAAHGVLGGTWGYGVDYANDVFEMRPYWWGDCACDEEHVSGCPGELPNFRYLASGLEIRWYKWIGRDMEYWPGEPDAAMWMPIFAECVQSITRR